jgi:hypothetical protein
LALVLATIAGSPAMAQVSPPAASPAAASPAGSSDAAAPAGQPPTPLPSAPPPVAAPATPAVPVAAPQRAPARAPKDGAGKEQADTLSEELRVGRRGLGLDPGALQYGGLVVPPTGQVSSAVIKPNQINFHGFLRVPMRIGIQNASGLPEGYNGVKFHTPPRLPDNAYTEWQYTNQLGGPWTQLLFSYGDARVSANVMLASYALSDASWKDLTAQLGINQAWVTFNFPDFFGKNGGFVWNVGAFQGGYGSPGRYDAGAYETYLFGRTHTAGETVAAFYDLNKDFTLQVEHGIGVRLEVQKFVANAPNLSFLPYAGPVQQLPTLLHHAHLGFTFKDTLTVAAHYIDSFTQASTGPAEQDGHITTFGVGAKLTNSRYGNGFLGYSHLDALNAIRVGGAIEVLHSWEGWSLAGNFWGPAAAGNGKIDSLLWEYTFSLATFLQGTGAFYGQSADLLGSLFGMYNRVSSNDPADPTFVNGRKKLKLGADVTYLPLHWLGISARYDLVQPDLNDSHKSFSVISPRFILRTSFVSHEEIYLQYSRYLNGSEVELAFPFMGTGVAADKDVVSIIANMYW